MGEERVVARADYGEIVGHVYGGGFGGVQRMGSWRDRGNDADSIKSTKGRNGSEKEQSSAS